MRAMKNVRIGVIGAGMIGVRHAEHVLAIPRAKLAAICARSAGRKAVADRLGAPFFTDAKAMIRSGTCDAVLIATPHDSHVALGIAALHAGLHVLVEKPIGVHVGEARKLVAVAARRKKQVFAAMFQQRLQPSSQLLRELVRGGKLGELQRVHWTVTDWFRGDAYYRSAPWRGTWAGEGGGVLLNQCPHQLDLWWWLFGQPDRVHGVCGFGRRHRIEVEDEATAIFEYESGLTGMFSTSTGEAPGVNRLEIAGTKGLAVLEKGTLTVSRNETPSDRFCRTTKDGFTKPASATETHAPAALEFPHRELIRDFVDAILERRAPIAPAAEGLHSLELANAIVLSADRGAPVDLPLAGTAYPRFLAARRKVTRTATGPS